MPMIPGELVTIQGQIISFSRKLYHTWNAMQWVYSMVGKIIIWQRGMTAQKKMNSYKVYSSTQASFSFIN